VLPAGSTAPSRAASAATTLIVEKSLVDLLLTVAAVTLNFPVFNRTQQCAID
jgi:hypothetical protein